jgi:hypothetical protein
MALGVLVARPAPASAATGTDGFTIPNAEFNQGAHEVWASHRRVVTVKRRYDPNNVFTGPFVDNDICFLESARRVTKPICCVAAGAGGRQALASKGTGGAKQGHSQMTACSCRITLRHAS